MGGTRRMIQSCADAIRQEVSTVIVGHEEAIDRLLVGLFSGGHVLLEDVPGVGKTTLAKALAASLGCPFSRIQCTPDLLPTDVVGTTVYKQHSGDFQFRPGPLFSPLVLVDEINRAVPRTQSALLEAMAERQITVDGETRSLPTPFFLIATQNPIESHGTFPLPEAQLDRFLMKTGLGYPERERERSIYRRARASTNPLTVKNVVKPEEIRQVQEQVYQVHVAEAVEDYMMDIIRATREHEAIQLGASPRALIALGLAAQAYAGIRGRAFVIPDDVKALAVDVLSHRMLLASSHRLKGVTPTVVIRDLIASIPVPVEDDTEVKPAP